MRLVFKRTVPPDVRVTVPPIADQITLAPVTRTASVTVDGQPVTPDAYSWLVSGVATAIGDTTDTVQITPTDGGTISLLCAVTIDGLTYRSALISFNVTTVHGFRILVNADFRQDVAIPGDGTYVIGGIPVEIAGSGGLASKAATVADGIYLLRNSAAIYPGAAIRLDNVLAAVGHTWDLAAWEYLIATDVQRGFGSGECVQNHGDALVGDRLLVGQRSGHMWLYQRGDNAWSTWPGTLGRAMVWIMRGHVFDIRHGAVADLTAWRGETTGLTRFGGTGKEERSFENTAQAPTWSSVPNTGTAPVLSQEPRGNTAWFKWSRLVIGARVRP